MRKPCPINIFDSFLGSLLLIIACIINKVVGEEKSVQVEREIKIYLTNLDIFEVGINTEQEKLKSTVQMEFGSRNTLLNIPDIMHKYGLLINLWEGSNQGE